jgi:hypothetical protein
MDEEYWSFQYCVFYNTSITSIAGYTGIPESLIYTQYRNSSSNNTGNTSIVKHTILEAPIFFI